MDFGTGELTVPDQACRVFGWEAGAVPSPALMIQSVHPDDRAAMKLWLSPPDGGKPKIEECFFRLAGDDRRDKLIYGRSGVATSRRGRPELLVGIVQDMTRLVEMERAAHQQAQFYRGIFDNSIWGIFQTTTDGHYLMADPALAHIFGYDTPNALLSALTNIGGQLYVDPTRRDEFVKLMNDRGVVSGFKSQVYRKDGSVIWISESCREVRAKDGRFLYFEGMVEEITARKRVAEELRAAKEVAEAANRAKSEFLGAVSSRAAHAAQRHHRILGSHQRRIARPGRRAVLQDLCRRCACQRPAPADADQRYSRLRARQSGRLPLREDKLDLPALIEDTVRFMAQRAEAGGVHLTHNVSNTPAAILGDERGCARCCSTSLATRSSSRRARAGSMSAPR